MTSLIIRIFGHLGGYFFARFLTANQPKILMYHRFSAEQKGHAVTSQSFEWQLKLIKRYFNPMTLAQLAQYIAIHNKAPKHAVVITVDDGYRDFYEVAYPLLKRYEVPATFFVTTGFVDGDVWLWPDQVLWLLKNKKRVNGSAPLGEISVDLSLSDESLWSLIVNYFLNISNEERLVYLKELEILCGVEAPKSIPDEYAAVNWQQLKEMQKNNIEIGGHTLSHPSLGHSSLHHCENEINQSLQKINEQLGVEPRTFCYPNGQPGDYSKDIKLLVHKSGYTAAVTAFSDAFNINIPYAWRRFVGCNDSFQFHKSLFGVEHLGNRFRNSQRCNY